MPSFRKKPVVIEAVPITDLLLWAKSDWQSIPEWVLDKYNTGDVLFLPGAIEIKTLEGTMTGSIGDWLIKGVQGEIYPCKPEIFDMTYERV